MNYKNLYHCLSFLLFLIITLPFSTLSSAAKSLDVSAYSAYVYIPEADVTVYEKNATVRRPMASTTKIMTAIIAIENSCEDDIIKIPKEAVGIEGTSAYLREGDEFTVSDLLHAVLLQSANDAATALAIGVGGSLEKFSRLMNEKAVELELEDTHFTNPHGLDDEQHYTSAKDLAKLASYALENPLFKTIVSTYRKTISSLDGECVRTVVNHNKMLLLYEGANGVKTGFTKKSGRCLVSSAERNGMTVVCVTLNAPSDWHDHRIMLDCAFDNYEKQIFAKENELEYALPVINGDKSELRCRNQYEISAILRKDSTEATLVAELDKFAVAPIKKGEVIGYVHYKIDSEIVASSPLIATETIKEQKYKKGIFGFGRT